MNESKKHIVFLTPGFAENESDSTTIPALQDYLKALIKELPNDKLTVIAFQFPYTNEKYYWHGIEIIPLNGKNKKFNRVLTWFKSWKTLNKLNSKSEITILHSFWIGECSLIGQNFAKKINIKHIVTAMGQDVFTNKYARLLKPDKTKIVTLSNNHRDLLFGNYKLKSEIIPWGFSKENFPDLKENEINILGVGSLNSVKNYQLFIEIIETLKTKYVDLKVAIIGEGKETEKIKKEISERNLNSTITLYGKLDRFEVLKKMSQSKILLHTSKYESFGYVFAEALYSGMKIVSFDVGTAKKIPEWNICYNNQEIIDTCFKLLENKETTKNRVLLNSQKEILNSYLKLYNE